MNKFITYIIKSESIDKLYIGYTANINQRLEKHNSKASKWTERGVPWKLVYLKEFDTKHDAIVYEHYLKSLKNRKYLEKIIAG